MKKITKIHSIWDKPPTNTKKPDFVDSEEGKWDWDNVLERMIKKDV